MTSDQGMVGGKQKRSWSGSSDRAAAANVSVLTVAPAAAADRHGDHRTVNLPTDRPCSSYRYSMIIGYTAVPVMADVYTFLFYVLTARTHKPEALGTGGTSIYFPDLSYHSLFPSPFPTISNHSPSRQMSFLLSSARRPSFLLFLLTHS